ncbi:LacI family DNA-binding transcriptional regulator [Nocardioides hwasunensis]|uniref:LacI family DNA-binding transcriptional regulator n=1 Tax=Nocardioides hwasunensis TaxID=397258 RepID=A0ABR8MM46_9ACTN|nr:LacI family DNA-binding transcriptional regulator [Nocardioides hwasunensis]MBD3915154.1 LacI family DNA-binding transcriptional regulator [Nocardioides hwasunensis]
MSTTSRTLPNGRRPSVKDVAELAQVSLGTVSNVLNRPARVSTGTRERVEKAMSDLGFVLNESARQLRMGRSNTFAYVMLDATNPFFNDVGRGIELAAEEADLSLFLCNSDGRSAREAAHLEHLQQQRVDGILITPVDPDEPQLRRIVQQGTPLVIVDRANTSGQFCSVTVDDRLGGRVAIEHLVDRGHTRVAYVGGPSTMGQVRDRYEGARAAWDEAGLAESDLLHVETTTMSVEEGRVAGERLAGLPRRSRPSAVFCANDLVALGLLQQVISTGQRVPEDLAIVGYDDIAFAAGAAVPLTSVRQPRQALGRTAAELLIEETTEPDHEHQQVEFTPELIARTSTLG